MPKVRLSSSHSSVVLGVLKGGMGFIGVGQVLLIGEAAGAGVSGVDAGCVAVVFVVATAEVSCVKFKFPGSVVLKSKLDAVEFKFAVEITEFIEVEGGAAWRTEQRRTSRQVALTRR